MKDTIKVGDKVLFTFFACGITEGDVVYCGKGILGNYFILKYLIIGSLGIKTELYTKAYWWNIVCKLS